MIKKLILSALFFAYFAGCSAKPTLKGVKVVKTKVESTITSVNSGTVDAEQQAVLGFSTVGRVTSLKVHVGDQVKRGQILAELENSDLKTVSHDSALELKRAHELFSAGLVSQVALDDAKRAFEIAQSNFEKAVIKAPFDGTVTQLDLKVGELFQTASANTGSAPIRLIDLKPRIVKGNIDEMDLAKVKVGTVARIKILAVRPQPFSATVTRVVPFVSTTKEQDRTSQIELKFNDANVQVPVGASADIEVVIDSRESVLAVPTRAVLGHGGQRYTFKWDGNKVQKVDVQLGLNNYDRAEVISGLAEGDTVVFPPEDLELREGLKAKAEVQPWP